MDPGMARIGTVKTMAGRAATLDVKAVDTVPAEPYKVQFEAVDALEDGQVMVVAAPSQVASAFWGELITTRAMKSGCVGTVVDGYCRDTPMVKEHDFGVWARGMHPADSLGRLDAVAFNVPVRCAGVIVNPGDFVLADEDGVVIVPLVVIDEVLARAEEKRCIENEVRGDLSAGNTIATTYERFGVM
jgi:regulator of RNase E activity RraA